jgi:hypothetical protein
LNANRAPQLKAICYASFLENERHMAKELPP